MKPNLLIYSICSLAVGLTACGNDDGMDPDGGTPDAGACAIEASFSSIVDNRMNTARCNTAGCHDTSTASGGLDFTKAKADLYGDLVGAASMEASFPTRVVANDRANSFLYVKISQAMPPGAGGRMPVGGMLDQCEIDAIGQWIDNGAAND